MKSIKVKIIVFSILIGILSLLMIAMTLFPIVRKYSVTNDTNESIYITPLMQLDAGGYSLEDEWEDADRMKDYLKKVDNFSILSQYLFYSPPAIPSFVIKDIKVNPNSKVVLYIDYENIRQERNPQILLIKDQQNNYYYKDADFWEKDKISDLNLLQVAPKNLIESKDKTSYSFRFWFIAICFLLLIVLLPYFLIKNIKILKKNKNASLR